MITYALVPSYPFWLGPTTNITRVGLQGKSALDGTFRGVTLLGLLQGSGDDKWKACAGRHTLVTLVPVLFSFWRFYVLLELSKGVQVNIRLGRHFQRGNTFGSAVEVREWQFEGLARSAHTLATLMPVLFRFFFGGGAFICVIRTFKGCPSEHPPRTAFELSTSLRSAIAFST